IPDVSSGKPANPRKVLPQIARQSFHHGFPPALSLLPLHDHAANVPVKSDKLLIDRLEGFVLGGTNPLFDFSQERFIGRCGLADSGHLFAILIPLSILPEIADLLKARNPLPS